MPRDYFAQFTWKKNMKKNKQTKKKTKENSGKQCINIPHQTEKRF